MDVDAVGPLRTDDAAALRGGDPEHWWMLSRLDRGGKVKATGGGDLSRVYGGEEGSGDSGATELTNAEILWCVSSCRGSNLSDVGLYMGDVGNDFLRPARRPLACFFWLWMLYSLLLLL